MVDRITAGFLKESEFAPGLPEKGRITPFPEGGGRSLPFVIQKHVADRAGLHSDIRISAGGVAHSWAWRSGKLPRVGERVGIFRQSDHEPSYMGFSGKIRSGHGKGRVSIARKGRIRLLDSTADKVHFMLGERRFALVSTPRYGPDSWLFIGLRKKPGSGARRSAASRSRTDT